MAVGQLEGSAMQLTSAESAQILGIKERAASKRYLWALARLCEGFSQMPAGFEIG